MVKPGGTGKPRLAISARLAPLPPRRSRRPAFPSALPSPKVNTHFPALTVSAAGTFACLAGGFAGPFFNVFRAETVGAGLVRPAAEGFDFAGIFFDFATALAMAL